MTGIIRTKIGERTGAIVWTLETMEEADRELLLESLPFLERCGVSPSAASPLSSYRSIEATARSVV